MKKHDYTNSYKVKSFCSLYYTNTQNCKLGILDNVGSCLKTNKKKTFELIEKHVKKDTFMVHVTKKVHIDTLSKKFDMVYCNKVPIGYGSGYQYHALFQHPKYCKYGKRISEYEEPQRYTKDEIYEMVRQILNDGRIKTQNYLNKLKELL